MKSTCTSMIVTTLVIAALSAVEGSLSFSLSLFQQLKRVAVRDVAAGEKE